MTIQELAEKQYKALAGWLEKCQTDGPMGNRAWQWLGREEGCFADIGLDHERSTIRA